MSRPRWLRLLILNRFFYCLTVSEEQDEDLKLALRMSLQTAEVQERMMNRHSESRRQRALSTSDSLAEESNDSSAGLASTATPPDDGTHFFQLFT